MKNETKNMETCLQPGDRVRIKTDTGFHLFREGHQGTVTVIRNRRNNDPEVVVEWDDLWFPSTYAKRYVEKL